jgi:putative phage-type endonuclease
MGVSKWKTPFKLYHEKSSDDPPKPPTDRMLRGIELEPLARDLFNIKTGFDMKPTVLVNDWIMASLDGRDEYTGAILEIKCPGEEDHAIALAGKVPDHYYPQLQHQIYVSRVYIGYYFSFDGADGVIVKVERDEDYIAKMLVEEKKFYDCMINKTPPEPTERDYVTRNDVLWEAYACQWKALQDDMKVLEYKEKELREQLIFLSGDQNTRGAGISLCKVNRKGNVDYSKIPELKDVDLEIYRKPTSVNWRITS